MVYVFMSFGSMHDGRNLGCCIVRVAEFTDANAECARLGLMPNECNEARAYLLRDEEFPAQGMELNRFYTRDEMLQMGFRKG